MLLDCVGAKEAQEPWEQLVDKYHDMILKVRAARNIHICIYG